MKRQEFYVYLPAIEFLPGKTMHSVIVTPGFATRRLAEQSLAMVRETYPGARIGVYTPEVASSGEGA